MVVSTVRSYLDLLSAVTLSKSSHLSKHQKKIRPNLGFCPNRLDTHPPAQRSDSQKERKNNVDFAFQDIPEKVSFFGDW